MWKETPTITLSAINGHAVKKQTGKTVDQSREISTRETEVLQLMADGKSSKQIADELCLSIDTVESHRKSLYKKLKVNSATEAVAWGFRKKVIK